MPSDPGNWGHLAEKDHKLVNEASNLVGNMDQMLAKHHGFIRRYGTDMPEVTNWKWSGNLKNKY
ncbi:MAG: hypothetical protein ABF679_13025 [Lentilactobacillus diolivorans]